MNTADLEAHHDAEQLRPIAIFSIAGGFVMAAAFMFFQRYITKSVFPTPEQLSQLDPSSAEFYNAWMFSAEFFPLFAVASFGVSMYFFWKRRYMIASRVALSAPFGSIFVIVAIFIWRISASL